MRLNNLLLPSSIKDCIHDVPLTEECTSCDFLAGEEYYKMLDEYGEEFELGEEA